MKTILAIAILALAACGSPTVEMPTEQVTQTQTTLPVQVAPVLPAASSATWHFTAPDVTGTLALTKTPMTPDAVSLSGTATVGAISGTVTGTENVPSGAFVAYIELPGARLVQINGRENGATLSGYVLDTAGFPVVNGRTDYNEPVTGTSP